MEEPALIYVNRITNLSDARYCAGMSVDFLGFVIDPASPEYVSPELFQDLVGWVSGPSPVLEVGRAALSIDALEAQYPAAYLHIPEDRLTEFAKINKKLIVEASPTSEVLTSKHQAPVAYWAIHEPHAPIEQVTAPYLVFFGSHQGPIRKHLASLGAQGIILSGSRESAPGLKDYDNLSGVLEELNG